VNDGAASLQDKANNEPDVGTDNALVEWWKGSETAFEQSGMISISYCQPLPVPWVTDDRSLECLPGFGIDTGHCD